MTITIQTLWLIGMQSVVHYPKHHKHSRDCVMKAQSLENALILGYASQGDSKELFSSLEYLSLPRKIDYGHSTRLYKIHCNSGLFVYCLWPL